MILVDCSCGIWLHRRRQADVPSSAIESAFTDVAERRRPGFQGR